MARKFFDLVQMDGVGSWEKILGYERIFTVDGWTRIYEKGRSVEKAKREGQIPIFVAEDIDSAKEGSWIEGIVIDIRTRIDMQVVNVMAERGVSAMITLDYIRSGSMALQNAALAIRLLHRGRVPIIMSTGAKQESELRAPRDIAATGRALGMSATMALASVSYNWGAVIES